MQIKPPKFTIRNEIHSWSVFFIIHLQELLVLDKRGGDGQKMLANAAQLLVSRVVGTFTATLPTVVKHTGEGSTLRYTAGPCCKPEPWTLAHSLFTAVLPTYLKSNVYPTLTEHRENILFQKKQLFPSNEKAGLICPL